MSQRWELNPRPFPYQGNVLPLNYSGVGGAGFAPAEAKLPSGLQPDPFVYSGTHPFPSIGETEVPPSIALHSPLRFVGMVGIEPTTSPLSGVRSTIELHAHHFFNITFYQVFCKLMIHSDFY